MLLIGLTGKAGSGKTTAARYLSDLYGIPRRPFAFPLKCMIGALGFPAEVLDGPSHVKELPTEKLAGHSLRHAMQTLGTQWGREIMGQDFWVRQWENTLDQPGCIADDVRFPNECEAIRSRGGVILRVERDGAGVRGEGAKHASEQCDKLWYDAVIPNNGSVDDFHARLGFASRPAAIAAGRVRLPVAMGAQP